MTDYFVDSRATGLNDGAAGDTTANTKSTDVVTDAWQSIADITGLVAGDTITFIRGSGPYEEVFDIQRNGTITTPMRWYCNGDLGNPNGVIIRAGDDLNAKTNAQWEASAGGTNEYYFTISGADPSLSAVDSATVDNYYRGLSAETTRKVGTIGALTDKQWAYGNNAADSLAYSTFYIRSDDGLPDTLDIIASQRDYVLDTSWRDHIFYDVDFRYGNVSTVRARVDVGHFWHFINPFIAFPESNGFDIASTGEVTIFNPRGAWCGHRFLSCSAAVSPNVTVIGGVERGAHLSFKSDPAVTGGIFKIYNFIGEDGEAGAYDANNALLVIDSRNCCWYPRMTASGGALAYNGTDINWPRTDVTDVPSYHDTTESNQANLIDPEFLSTIEGHLSPSDFMLSANSPLKGRGIGYSDLSNPGDLLINGKILSGSAISAIVKGKSIVKL